jgi:transposase-like protein
MKYTISQFNKDFSDDNACLNYIFKARFNGLKCPKCDKTAFYQVGGRKSFACSCGYQINPTANTIFHKSDTSLKDWFFAIYLESQSKNGLSAKELQRHLGCTYKTAWRIGYKIRSLMEQGDNMLSGTIETDETYIGGRTFVANKRKNKGIVMAMVQRKGQVKSKHISDTQSHTLIKALKDNVAFGSRVITDDNSGYKPNKVMRIGMFHDKICHSKKEYVKGDIYTNTIEGFFSQFKRSIDGTYHSVSSKHLQSYVDQFSFHYNNRSACFYELLDRLCGLHDLIEYKNLPAQVQAR